eukprot:TRINITY_DN4947_c0_g1_i1.p2 TRINITY_DN4947_c0_g1~~TRINITY_DN4947_c0_g1_i1.p2  ORF type:complete len:137 (+),score=5.36 TRINITY_DN4947_c0_g1_i1:776-1186(+)
MSSEGLVAWYSFNSRVRHDLCHTGKKRDLHLSSFRSPANENTISWIDGVMRPNGLMTHQPCAPSQHQCFYRAGICHQGSTTQHLHLQSRLQRHRKLMTISLNPCIANTLHHQVLPKPNELSTPRISQRSSSSSFGR